MVFRYLSRFSWAPLLVLGACFGAGAPDQTIKIESDPDQPTGGWISSGGDGVLCLKHDDPRSPELIRQIEKDYRELGYFSAATKGRVLPFLEELTLLEYWEERERLYLEAKDRGEKPEDKNLDPNLPYSMGVFQEGEGVEERLQQLEEDFRERAPVFARVYRVAAELVKIDTLHMKGIVPRVDDARPTIDLGAYPNCTLVQLAHRRTSPTHKLAKEGIETILDKDLYPLLKDDLNRAMLINHERYYVLAVAMESRSSNNLRKMNSASFTMSGWIDGVMNPMRRVAEAKFQRELSLLVGEYIFLRSELPDFPWLGKPIRATRYSRYLSLLQLREQQIYWTRVCLEKVIEQAQGDSIGYADAIACSHFGTSRIPQGASSEVAFLFLVQPKFEVYPGSWEPWPLTHTGEAYPVRDFTHDLVTPGLEHLVDFDSQDPLKIYPVDFEAMKVYCEKIREDHRTVQEKLRLKLSERDHEKMKALTDIYPRAEKYCQRSGV